MVPEEKCIHSKAASQRSSALDGSPVCGGVRKLCCEVVPTGSARAAASPAVPNGGGALGAAEPAAARSVARAERPERQHAHDRRLHRRYVPGHLDGPGEQSSCSILQHLLILNLSQRLVLHCRSCSVLILNLLQLLVLQNRVFWQCRTRTFPVTLLASCHVFRCF